MTRTRAARLLTATTLGLLSAAACAAGLPEGAPEAPGKEHVTPPEELAVDAGASGDAGDAGPKCPHGALEDPHRGFIRCLEPGETDAGPPAPAAPDAGAADAGAADAAPLVPAGPPPSVEVGEPEFENGEVPNVPKTLTRAAPDVARCIADAGGLLGSTGSLKVQFLVRSRGRAEGVEVLAAKNVPEAAKACVRQLLKNKAVGSPTADPVGVTVTFTLKAPGR